MAISHGKLNAKVTVFARNFFSVVYRAEAGIVGIWFHFGRCIVVGCTIILVDILAVFDISINERLRVGKLVVVIFAHTQIPSGGISDRRVVVVDEFLFVRAQVVNFARGWELQLSVHRCFINTTPFFNV